MLPVRVGEDLHLDVPRAQRRPARGTRARRRRRCRPRASPRRAPAAALPASRRAACRGRRRRRRPSTKIGKPMSSACATSSSTSSDAGVERSTGTPAAIACSFAVTLLPAISSTSRRRADEGDAVRRGARRELRVLGEESVARVDRVGAARRSATRMISVDVEVGAHRVTRLADLVRLVGLLSVQRVAVLVRVHRDGARTQFECGAERSNGDLAAVRDQDLSEHAHLAGRSSAGG